MGAVILSLCLAYLAGLGILCAVVFDLVLGTQRIWSPRDPAHQAQTTWAFRAMVYPLVIATFVHMILREHSPPLMATLSGGVLIGTGLAAALAATLQMGWHNAFGAGTTLVTTGWFRLCRHPVYTSSFVFLAGWALVAWSPGIAVGLGI